MATALRSCCLILVSALTPAHGADESLSDGAASALRRATAFFRDHVSAHGGYLWRYSADLRKREGEAKAGAETVWVQPPGTPSVGAVFLDAFEATGDRYYLEAARETGECLVRGQLLSGGWDYQIEFDPTRRERYAYRIDAERPEARSTATLDDNTTQAALRFLMRLDTALEQKNRPIHETVEFALSSLLKVQYPNGAWPQRFDKPPDPSKYPVVKASYPESWPREFPDAHYRGYYTFNDNAIDDVIDVMFIAARTYDEEKYRRAAEKAGGFILLAQMPEPQPAWAQQYDADMKPAWARRFEPPAITGSESQSVLMTLLDLYRQTGDKRYLDPVPRAIEYLRRSRLPDGRLVRFYELRTNRPLYFTRKYELTYEDDDLPTHYAFKVRSLLDRIEARYERLSTLSTDELKASVKPPAPKLSEGLEREARAAIAALDERGRWIEDGRLRGYGPDDDTGRIISCQTFIRNVGILSRYLAAARGG